MVSGETLFDVEDYLDKEEKKLSLARPRDTVADAREFGLPEAAPTSTDSPALGRSAREGSPVLGRRPSRSSPVHSSSSSSTNVHKTPRSLTVGWTPMPPSFSEAARS